MRTAQSQASFAILIKLSQPCQILATFSHSSRTSDSLELSQRRMNLGWRTCRECKCSVCVSPKLQFLSFSYVDRSSVFPLRGCLMTSVATYGGQKECLFLNLMISTTVGSIMWRNDNGIADHIFRKHFILLECTLHVMVGKTKTQGWWKKVSSGKDGS